MRTAATLVMCGLLLLAGAFDASGQSFQGGIRGAVRDANGVIPGAEITLTNQDTNVARTTVSNEVGEYNFPNVTPGTYTLKAALTGFKTFERAGVRIGTQQFITLDLPLEVGNIQESITVTGDAPLIETSNASTGGTLDREALESLPAPGRNAFMMAVTVPTVMAVGDPQFNRQQDQTNASRVSLGGGGLRANNYLLDGVPISELRGRAILNPTIEAIEEVKVQVHTYDAEMGRTGGGVFNVTAKSGTNAFHGSGFYQTRPVWGQSENFFNEKAGLSKEETGLADAYYRLYGGGVGGPIVQNRTFFWAATEGYRSGTTRNLAEIWPSVNQRAGRFLHLDGQRRTGAPLQSVLPGRCRTPVARQAAPVRSRRAASSRMPSSRAIIRPPARWGSIFSTSGRPKRSPARWPRTRTTSPTPSARRPSSTRPTCSPSRLSTSSPTPGR